MQVVIPIKQLDRAKQRLANRLAPWQRQALVQAMLFDLLGALQGLHGVAGVTVVCEDEQIAPLQRKFDFERLSPPERGLNQALSHALADLAARGRSRVLILHGDLPLARTRELQHLVDDPAPILLVPDRHGRGTNAMLLPCPAPLAPAFGPRSLARHAQAARSAGVVGRIRHLASLALDVDDADDLMELLACDSTDSRRSTALLRSWLQAEFRPPAADRTSAGIAWG
jgi:2-phospho-L-lactate guanylyltransferase